jgi:hypothetical protein
MMFLDKTFCNSPNCKNVCGRQMTDEERNKLIYLNNPPVSYGYFCDKPPWIHSYIKIPKRNK